MTLSDPLYRAYDSFLLDLDGVVYRGHHPLPHAVETLNQLTSGGDRVCYVTNNASRTPEDVAAELTQMGLQVSRDEVITSAQAGAALLGEQIEPGSTVLALGGPGVAAALREAGFTVIDAITDPVAEGGDQVAGVMQGFGRDVDWKSLTRASFVVAAGVPWVATNVDLTLPVDGGIAPGNGTLVNAVATATKRQPEVAGKPFPPLLLRATTLTKGMKPLVVGDRLDTDIEGATNAQMAAVLVLTGVSGPLDLWRARDEQRPRHLVADLRGLMEPPLTVATQGDVVTCGDARASIERRELVLDTGSSLAAGVWAAAHLLWRQDVEPDNAADIAFDLHNRLVEASNAG